jgi:VanZ family protein
MKRAFRLLLVVGAALGIMVASLSPNPPQVLRMAAGLDKVQHAAAFTVLSLLIIWALRGDDGRSVRLSTALGTALFCLAYGALIEFLQQYTGRTPELGDLIADLAGTATGIVASWIGEIVRRRKESTAPR